MSSNLRDEIAKIVQNAVREGDGSLLNDWALTYADDILAIPAIAESSADLEDLRGIVKVQTEVIAELEDQLRKLKTTMSSPSISTHSDTE